MGMKEAKEQFIKFGKVRNDFVRKEILASWERSRIYKVSQHAFEKSIIHSDNQHPTYNQINKEGILGQGMLIDTKGDVLFQTGNEFQINAIMNVEEKKIGTTAFALSCLTKEFEFVENEEHYLDLFSAYYSYAKYIHDELLWILFFSKTPITLDELCDIEKQVMGGYKERKRIKKEKEVKENIIYLNSENIDNTIILAGISREILAAKKQIKSTFSNSVNLKLITRCKLTLHAMVEIFIENKSIETKNLERLNCTFITKDNVNALENGDFAPIVYIEEIHKFSYKQQMHLVRQLQEKKKEQCYIWGFHSIQDIEETRGTTIPLIFEYLRGNQIELRDLDVRREDITFIAQKYLALNYPEMKVESSFLQILSDLKQSKRLEDLLNYLRFVCDMNSQMKRVERHTESKRLLNDKTKGPVRESNEVLDCVTLKDSEREQIEKALRANQYQLNKTALSLGIGRTTLYRKIKYYNIQK